MFKGVVENRKISRKRVRTHNRERIKMAAKFDKPSDEHFRVIAELLIRYYNCCKRFYKRIKQRLTGYQHFHYETEIQHRTYHSMA
jgi:hypothetical protein